MGEDWVRDGESARRIDKRTKESTAASYSREPAAQLLEYDEYRDDERLTCPRCGWSGQAREADTEFYEELFDFSYPNCEKMLLVVNALVSVDPATSAAKMVTGRVIEDIVLTCPQGAEPWER